MHIKKIQTKGSPKALGPYSQAVLAGDFLFCSGQIGIDPKTDKLVPGGIKKQARQILRNLRAVLEASNANFSKVVKCDIFLKNLSDFSAVNNIYAKFFKNSIKPARQTVQASGLPKGALLEISCIAYLGGNK